MLAALRPLVLSAVALATAASAQDGAPSAFVPNMGQWNPAVQYQARFGGSVVALEGCGWTVSFGDGRRVASLRMEFEGAGEPEPEAGARLSGVHDYFLGADSSRWRTGVPRFDSVRYRGMYEGIDVRAYDSDGHFEYDLELSPGAELVDVVVRVAGVESMHIAEAGHLSLTTAVGEVRMTAPRTWELDAEGEPRPLASRYVRLGVDRFGFAVPDWDGDSELVLDPGILYSTLVSGSGMDIVRDIDLERGIRTLAGQSWSQDYPTSVGAYGTSLTAPFRYDVIVTSLDVTLPPAQQMLYSTYLGGGEDEDPVFVSVDDGVITVAGNTGSRAPTTPSFPVTANAFAPVVPATTSVDSNMFVARLDPSLSGAAQLVYASYFGGDGDLANAAARDDNGQIAITGKATPGYPTTPNAFQSTHSSGVANTPEVFVAVIDPSLPPANQLFYSTYLGQLLFDEGLGIAFGDGGVVTVVGQTTGSAFPVTADAYDATYNAGGDGFLSQLDPALPPSQQLIYSTFLGGSGALEIDQIDEVHVDGSIITTSGITASEVFPTTAGAFLTTCSGFFDAFIARFDLSLPPSQQLVYSTCIGGLNSPVKGMVVESSGVVTLCGSTISLGIPTTPGAYLRSVTGNSRGWITRFDPARPAAQQLLYGSYFAPSVGVHGMQRGDDGDWTIVGDTTSALFPVTVGVWNNVAWGSFEGTLTVLDLLPTGAARYGAASAGCDGSAIAGVTSMPQLGSATFSITCTDAPASAAGVLLLGSAGLGAPLPIAGIGLLVDPVAPGFLGVPVASDARGACDVPLPLLGPGSLIGLSLHTQFVWAESPAACAPSGLSASQGLQVTIQP